MNFLQQTFSLFITLYFISVFPAFADSNPDAMVEAFSDDQLSIVPLIESANITLFNQTSDAIAEVKYRKSKGGKGWHKARQLVWEPVESVLTGPLVYLQASTTYEVKITLTDANQDTQTIKAQFTTRPDSPPIDPDKVYYLKDIYAGGTLDLEELGIEGEAGAWAKIVGNESITIEATEGRKNAIFIGDNSYVYLENITVRGGRTHAIYSEYAHHLWINKCDIAEWGREPNFIINGKAYELEDAQPINYDSAFYFKQSGVITVENCHVHHPTPFANDWSAGHPNGPNAFLAHANHPNPAYKGQIILRNNVFEGSPEHRFNDVIEGRKNTHPRGGFVRDSAIYSNTLRYANDDAIELDGGQQNVLVYNNRISHAYAGISMAPVRVGPSFAFNNYIHNLGDQRGKQWAAIKLGGLVSAPEGQAHLFHNLITVARNGITASHVKNDNTYWAHAQNNIIITRKSANLVGYNIYDPKTFIGNQYLNDFLFNLTDNAPKIRAEITAPYHFENEVTAEKARQIYDNSQATTYLQKAPAFHIDNFTQYDRDGAQFLYGVYPQR